MYLFSAAGIGVVDDVVEDLDPSVQDYTDEDYNDVFDATSNG